MFCLITGHCKYAEQKYIRVMYCAVFYLVNELNNFLVPRPAKGLAREMRTPT
jgi:hypothetical protein